VAKDGTRRGGARTGAGRKAKALEDHIADGKTWGVKVLKPPEQTLQGVSMPPVKAYLKAVQHGGEELSAEDIYTETWNWLLAKGCAEHVNPQLIEQYAMSAARWIQCEEAVSKFGMLAKHPTTGAAIASPFVSMSQNFMKQVNQCWFQIYQIVKENCSVGYGGASPQDDVMERLLRKRE